MHLKDLKKKTPAELVAMAEEMGVEGASTLRKQDLMFSILKVRAENGAEIMGMGTIEVLQRRLRLPALARGQLPRRSRRHLCRAQPGPQIRPAHRRHGRRRDPRPQGRRALFRADPHHPDQFRRSRRGPPPRQFRQSDAALSRQKLTLDSADPTAEGQVGAGDRHRLAAGQGPARADRRAAAHRQDRAAAEHRQGDHRQSSRGVPDRAADRRAARGSHRHAAHA